MTDISDVAIENLFGHYTEKDKGRLTKIWWRSAKNALKSIHLTRGEIKEGGTRSFTLERDYEGLMLRPMAQ